MADIKRLTVDCDLTEAGVVEACAMLSAMPEDVLIVCPSTYAAPAQEIKDHFRCKIVLVPPDMLASRDAWCASINRDYVWSPGA